MNIEKEVKELLNNFSLKDEILGLHQRLNNNYDGFDTYDDYVKYGDMFVQVKFKDNTNPTPQIPKLLGKHHE